MGSQTALGPLLVSLGMVILTACSGSDQEEVAVLGDSIIQLVDEAMREEIDDGTFDLEVVAVPGAVTSQVLDRARPLADGDPVAVIVNLGTNDVLGTLPVEGAASSMFELVGLFPDATCIALTTVHEGMPTVVNPSSPREDAAALNDAISALADSDPRITAIDWNAAVEASADPLLDDGIHPNARGQEVLVEEYTRFVRDCPID